MRIGGQDRLLMQLLEVEIITEDASVPVERDGFAVRLKENIQNVWAEREDLAGRLQEVGKDTKAFDVVLEEVGRIDGSVGILRQEHLDAVLQIRHKGQIMSWLLVAVRLRFRNDILFSTREDFATAVRTRLANCGEQVLLHMVGRCDGLVKTAVRL